MIEMQLEQVYELNLPSFSEIIRKDFTGFRSVSENYDYLAGKNLNSIIKPEWLNFHGFKWNSFRYFKKNAIAGSIHTDLDSEEDYYAKKCIWGINWIFNGSGTIDFWHFKNVNCTGNTLGPANSPKIFNVPKFIATTKPDFSYSTFKDKVYLINASLPHKAIGDTNRCAFSLRTDILSTDWETIVYKFKEYIIYQ